MQLSLLEPTFDETRAIWHTVHATKEKYCRVLAYVPQEARDHLELSYSIHHNKQAVKDQAELWEHVAYAIWCASDLDWIDAINLLVSHRERKEPIEMLIYEKFIQAFSRIEIVEYLER